MGGLSHVVTAVSHLLAIEQRLGTTVDVTQQRPVSVNYRRRQPSETLNSALLWTDSGLGAGGWRQSRAGVHLLWVMIGR